MKMMKISVGIAVISAAIGSLLSAVLIVIPILYKFDKIFLIIGIIMFLYQSYILISIIKPRYIFIISCWLILINIFAAIGISSMAILYGDHIDNKEKVEIYREIPLPHQHISIRKVGESVIIDNVRLARIAYTGSMIPIMYGGNTAISSVYSYSNIKQGGICKDIRVGEIIIFVRGDDLIAHRVIDNSIGNGMLKTGADNAPSDYEETVNCKDIRYKQVGILWS